jgi:hypothetical protein
VPVIVGSYNSDNAFLGKLQINREMLKKLNKKLAI